ncbi:hypothetical protein F4604DRAFT_1987170 [Suillus subluteus]|nr:hypothetical protein F4604DRAFT_1987170 [Suillus subluteus]
MSIKHIPHKLTCQHPLLRLLPDRYAPPSLSFILNTTRQLLRHRLHIRNKRLMRPLHHIPFLSHSLNGSLTQAGPLNFGTFQPTSIMADKARSYAAGPSNPPLEQAYGRRVSRGNWMNERLVHLDLVRLIHSSFIPGPKGNFALQGFFSVFSVTTNWEAACDAASGGAQCNQVAVASFSTLLAAPGPCEQQNTADNMVDLAKTLSSNTDMIKFAQIFSPAAPKLCSSF